MRVTAVSVHRFIASTAAVYSSKLQMIFNARYTLRILIDALQSFRDQLNFCTKVTAYFVLLRFICCLPIL